MTLTIGMRELATEHLQSGVANTASALVQLLGLVFGVEIGRSIAVNWLGPVGQVAPEPRFSGWQLLVAIAAGLAFTLTLRALVFIVPGVLMLVPGSAGYNSVLQLVTDQTISGITAGFDTFVTAISIAYGLMVSTVVLPRRSTRIDRGDDRARAPADSGS
jgi:uncharacterized membrane protein YjjP (DUF1212 family)